MRFHRAFVIVLCIILLNNQKINPSNTLLTSINSWYNTNQKRRLTFKKMVEIIKFTGKHERDTDMLAPFITTSLKKQYIQGWGGGGIE